MVYIDRLRGCVVDVEKDHVVLDVHGVGYLIFMHEHALQSLKCDEKILIYIQQQITEFDTRLFGFLKKKDKKFFAFLHKISGVSAKIAFSILNNQEIFIAAVMNNEKKELEVLPGIGKKIAERLITESRKFVEENFDYNTEKIVENKQFQQNIREVKSALKNLGYKQGEINAIVKNFDTEDQNSNIEDLIRKSLLMIK